MERRAGFQRCGEAPDGKEKRFEGAAGKRVMVVGVAR